MHTSVDQEDLPQRAVLQNEAKKLGLCPLLKHSSAIFGAVYDPGIVRHSYESVVATLSKMLQLKYAYSFIVCKLSKFG